MKSVLLGCSSAPDRGSGILAYTKELIRGYRRAGIEVHLAAPEPVRREVLSELDVRFFPTPRHSGQISNAIRLVNYIAEQRISGIINSDNSLLQSISPLVDVPFISIGHMSKTSIASLACYNNKYVDHVVAISYDMQRRFIEKYKVPAFKVPVLLSGIDRPLGFDFKDSGQKLCLIFAGGGNIGLKGADQVAKLVRRWGSNLSECRLKWFGDVPSSWKADLERSMDVRFYGRLERSAFLRQLETGDIFLFPSRYEGCPFALMEAMTFGLMPITSDGVGAMRWMVQSGVNGFVVPEQNWSDESYRIISGLLDDKDRLQRLREAASKAAEVLFDLDTYIERINDLMHTPTVDRSVKPTEATILRWHRPSRNAQSKAPFIDRVAIRTGYLRREGKLSWSNSNLSHSL
ncbi:hypothetical protein CHH26_13080 [Qipengyuania flava]|uniref:glycosyltransferase family 4 protein n=1 Tax=Qipengyuania flava TaxID=192812 RepID=UPI000B8BD66E|nr:glycosyltransferase family 4 protein [Qipengyuania flava]ASP31055.1 hypothetical protein CHH26_13080 [Qipengyuania flava]